MIDFAIIALPRSGTAWAANFLTTDASVCIHDPMATMRLDDMEGIGGGVACTALWTEPEFVYINIKRWIILERNISEVNQFAFDAGYQPFTPCAIDKFQSLRGPRMPWTALFDECSARDIFEYLKPAEKFNVARHAILRDMKVETVKSYV